MSQTASDATASLALLPDTAAWRLALRTVMACGHAHLPLLPPSATAVLLESCSGLRYRAARPLVGAAGREVSQDFDLTMEIPEGHAIRDLAARLDAAVKAAAAGLEPDPLPAGFRFNDLIVQRYPEGSRGISPHRDHLRYSGLVVLITLCGAAPFHVCDDRSGAGAKELAMPPGGAVLLAAPGFAGGRSRPFHFLGAVTQPRISLGIRHDTRPGEPT